MAVMTDSTTRHAEFELATNTALSDFPNVEAKREEKRNCLKHLVGRIDVFTILPNGFGKSLIFKLFPRIKRALECRQDRMPFTIVVSGNSVDCHCERLSGTFEQNPSSGGIDRRRYG